MSRVLFVCVHNAGRSQMSQALFERAANGRHEARSAGTEPADHVHRSVVTVMLEQGIDLSRRKPRILTDELARWSDIVITMGCGDACPVIPGKRYIQTKYFHTPKNVIVATTMLQTTTVSANSFQIRRRTLRLRTKGLVPTKVRMKMSGE